jgi:hypothetical protein
MVGVGLLEPRYQKQLCRVVLYIYPGEVWDPCESWERNLCELVLGSRDSSRFVSRVAG